MRSDSAFAESRTVPSSRGTGCSPSSLYAFLVLPRLGSVLPSPHCGRCQHSSWFSLEDLAPRLSCPRCLAEFEFPSGSPPHKDAWAYRVIGPFAAGHFAGGAYCVATAL